MANPRQRRKAKSSTHRPVSRSRRQKTLQKKMPSIRGPKVLREAWDKKKTVRQNYAALGLVHSLNPQSSGGVDHEPNDVTETATTRQVSGSEPTRSTAIPKGHGKIIRDESGSVMRVEFAEEDQDEESGGGEDREKDMEELEKEMVLDGEVMASWVEGIGGQGGGKGRRNDVVQELERVSEGTRTMTGRRHVSRNERQYILRLVEKYGVDDVEGMSRDVKLNSEQRTVGELRRGVRDVKQFTGFV